jgi:IrrE N-terminal-like domain
MRRSSSYIACYRQDVEKISAAASDLRVRLSLPENEKFPIIDVLEFELSKVFPNFCLIIDSDDRFDRGVLAFATTTPEIVVRETIYTNAINGCSRARYVLAHELGHVWLSHGEVGRRTFNLENKLANIWEWQANEFAAEIMVPSHFLRFRLVKDMSIKNKTKLVQQVSSLFAFSKKFVERRIDVLNERENMPFRKGVPMFESYLGLVDRYDLHLLTPVPD